MMGSVGNLYESIENLNDTYMQAPEAKDALLKPHVFAPAVPLLLPGTQTSIPTSYYMCSSYCWNNVAKEPTANSPQCGHLMNAKVTSIGSPDADNQSSFAITLYKCNRNSPYMTDVALIICPKCNTKLRRLQVLPVKPPNKQSPSWRAVGFVKGVVTYIVMDNLEVKPMSTISSISILNEFNIKEVSSLEERVVDVGMDQAFNYLLACGNPFHHI
ncbi:hypothetical protein SLEP1_g5674 [Rubroshorea leprosula]|uniref:Uncharacterized protein n=1 Tax=Rubroshorea leprosula TaxID=152421 RepID=A0AAV5HYJ4_9ROSI|nr:hypothetical protein SLEP1_g5674 [Rubroshorea leprosula]